MKSVWILALDGVMDSSLSITLDVLRAAQAIVAQGTSPAPFEYRVLGTRAHVQTSCGLKLRTDDTFRKSTLRDGVPHWVIVPAMGEYGHKLASHFSRPDAIQARQLLQTLHASKVRIGASCAARPGSSNGAP